MRSANSTFIQEKNKDANYPIHLYEIYDYDGGDTNLYFAAFDENVTFDGVTYTKFPITHENVGENTSGEIDVVQIRLSNVSRQIQYYLENYDLRGKKVIIKTVWANQLADASAYLNDEFYIDSYTATAQDVIFFLTSKFDILDVVLPGRSYSRNYCGWKFKSTECGYSSAETSCNKTWQRCKELNNQQRFGGFPSIPMGRLVV